MADDLYRHHKGGLYRLLLEATDEATGHPVMVYRSEQDGRVWVRTAAAWNGHVHAETPDGKATRVPRFARVEGTRDD
jgi:hypothetical protein